MTGALTAGTHVTRHSKGSGPSASDSRANLGRIAMSHISAPWASSDTPDLTLNSSEILRFLCSFYSRISDLAVVPYGQDKSARRDFRGSDARNPPRRVTPGG